MPTVLVWANFLGWQNAAVGNQHTHTVLQRWVLLLTVSERFAEPFNEETAQFASDVAKAFKLVPSVESLLHLAVIVHLDPYNCLAFLTPSSHARYLAWCCWLLAVIAGMLVEHCGAERKTTVMPGWNVWRKFANFCGSSANADFFGRFSTTHDNLYH